MKKNICWILAFIISVYLSLLQLIMTSEFPLITEVNTGKQKIKLELPRFFSGENTYPLLLPVEDIAIKGYILYNSNNDPLTRVELKREGDKLIGFLPVQKSSGSLIYQVILEKNKSMLDVNGGKPITLRFKNEMPFSFTFTYCMLIFLILLLNCLTGLFTIFSIGSFRWMIPLTVFAFFILGAVVNPIFQKLSLNSSWSDLTKDWNLNLKIFLSFLVWIFALLLYLINQRRILPVMASVATIVIFAIPHHYPGEEPVRISLDVIARNFLFILQLF